MWIKKKKIVELEKRIADLEVQVQSQQKPKYESKVTSDGTLVRTATCELPEDKLETVIIDIPNKIFTVNGLPFGESHAFHMSFEDGKWYLSVEIPHKFRTESFKKYTTKGIIISDEKQSNIK